MYSEKDIISFFLSGLPKPTQRHNDFFESDAEIVPFLHDRLLFTTDEFSQEDLFQEGSPYSLGWNLATATISDILATGGRPLYFGHSVSVCLLWDETYIRELARGIGDVLLESSCSFIGGDLGISEQWKYTGICIGTTENSITRKGAYDGEVLYMTGQAGLGNLVAATSIYEKTLNKADVLSRLDARFPLRVQESQLISSYSNCCMDTSDGVLNTLNTLAEINGLGYTIQNPPTMKEGVLACQMLELPEVLLSIGECGEYELLFSLSQDCEYEFLQQARKEKLNFSKLGHFTQNPARILNTGKIVYTFNDFNLSARSFRNPSEYLSELVKYLAHARKS